MVAAIAARSGSGTVIERKTAVHIEVTGADPNIAGGGAGGTITANSIANPTSVSSAAHGLQTGDVILIAGSNSTPTLNGERSVTVTGAGTFTVPVNVTVAGTAGTWTFVRDSAGRGYGAERRHYIFVDAPAGTDDAKSVIFVPSSDGKFTWDGYIFPEDGSYTLRLRDASDDTELATVGVTVGATT